MTAGQGEGDVTDRHVADANTAIGGVERRHVAEAKIRPKVRCNDGRIAVATTCKKDMDKVVGTAEEVKGELNKATDKVTKVRGELNELVGQSTKAIESYKTAATSIESVSSEVNRVMENDTIV